MPNTKFRVVLEVADGYVWVTTFDVDGDAQVLRCERCGLLQPTVTEY